MARSQSSGMYTVGGVAEAAGVSAQTIREWERQGLLRAVRTPGGQRRFTESARHDARNLAASKRRAKSAAAVDTRSEDGEELAQTGARIRAARLRAGLSQSEAAAKIGVSRSFLSTVERGQSGVSTHVLSDMADAFGIPMGEFSPTPSPTSVLHPAERPRTVLAGGVTWEELVTPGRAMEPALLIVPPGQTSGGTVTRPGETFVFVLDATLTFQLVGTAGPIDVGPGDALLIEAADTYSWENRGAEPARVLWVEEVRTRRETLR